MKLRILLIGAVLAMSFMSCSTMQGPTNGGSSRAHSASGGVQFQNPEVIQNVVLVGTRGNDSIQYVFKADGILEYSLNENTYVGTWEFDSTRQMMKYTISWEEDGVEKGYLVDIAKVDTTYIISGYWYVTDAMISMRDEVIAKE